jgi:hypothetical protein
MQISDTQYERDLRLCSGATDAQDLSDRMAQLKAAGCARIFREKVSGATTERPQLKQRITNELDDAHKARGITLAAVSAQ